MVEVVLIARNRPSYTAQAIAALGSALSVELGNEYLVSASIDPLLSGVDRETLTVCEEGLRLLSEFGLADAEVNVNSRMMGVGGNHLVSLASAFEVHRADFVVLVEDDATLTADALVLAEWFFDNYGQATSPYTLLSMCNHTDYGRGFNPGGIADDPQLLAESVRITSPFAFAVSRHQWPFLKYTWNSKEVPPTGWDYSLSFAMRLAMRKALHPVLSRCANVGRLGGAHETPESWDATQTNVVLSDGSYRGQYDIVSRVLDTDLLVLDDWIRAELGTARFR